MDSISPSDNKDVDNKDVKAAEKKQAFKEGAMDNTGKLPDVAQPGSANKESVKGAPTDESPDQDK